MNFDTSTAPDFAALLRVKLTYLWRHRRLPNLTDPSLFTEIVQLRKLYDRDPRLPIMADKVAVKSLVSDCLGDEWVVPMLWSGAQLPKRSSYDGPIVIKSRHGCRQNLIVRNDDDNWTAARHLSDRWTRKPYGGWLDEWLYSQIPRGLLIEPFIGAGTALPIDYKIYVFHGQATHVQAHLDRAGRHRWVIYDTNWRAITSSPLSVVRPSALSAMLSAAEELAKDFAFARVDFYQPGPQPLFGEMTFYPGSGLDPFEPPELDEAMGALWLASPALPLCTDVRREGALTLAA